MKYLVLGSNGFIGRNLIKQLKKEKCDLRLFDLRINKESSCINNNIEYIQGEFGIDCDFDSLTKDVDIVYHLISTTIPSSNIEYNIEIQQNVMATIKLLDSCVKNKIKKIIFISSGGTVYGKSKGIPFKEDDCTNPICSYGIQKLSIEKYIQLYHNMYGLDYRIIRLANPYGIGQNPIGGLGAVTTFVYKLVKDEPITIFGDGGVVRDYIYIDDAILDIINITRYEGNYKLFNVGSGIGHSLNEIVGTIEEVLNKRFVVNYEKGRSVDVPYNVLDIERLKSIFPNRKTTSLAEGIRILSDYFIKIY